MKNHKNSRLKTNVAGLLYRFRRLFSSEEDSRVKPTLRVVAVEFKPFQIIKGRLKPVFRRPLCRFISLPIQIRTSRGSRRLRPRRFSRRRGLWAGRAFSSCCRTGQR